MGGEGAQFGNKQLGEENSDQAARSCGGDEEKQRPGLQDCRGQRDNRRVASVHLEIWNPSSGEGLRES